MFEIGFTAEAVEDLRGLRKYDQQRIRGAIKAIMTVPPLQETRNCKRLRPNALAEWELRLGQFRVFFDADEVISRITVEAIGYKEGNTLFIHGQEYQL